MYGGKMYPLNHEDVMLRLGQVAVLGPSASLFLGNPILNQVTHMVDLPGPCLCVVKLIIVRQVLLVQVKIHVPNS